MSSVIASKRSASSGVVRATLGGVARSPVEPEREHERARPRSAISQGVSGASV